MADKNISMLPQVPQLDDESLMIVEQQGAAMKMTGRQFKDFGRQSVIEEVQGYVEQAQSAARSATGAVKAVTDMTVEAYALDVDDAATVEKTVRDGVFNLSFGLPRGEQGKPGEKGEPGPRGAKGDPGTGLKVLGYYDTPESLEAAVPTPEPGDAYGVGTEAPYDIYVFDSVTLQWKNNGPFSGGGGSILPENVVTSEGGAELEIPASFGDTPHTVTFTDEEEPPLTAEDIVYGEDGTVQGALEELFTSVGDGKALVASAITGKGVPTAQDAAFAQMAENIGKISGGADTSDATAKPGDILAGKTAYTAAGKVEGIIPTLAGQVITPGTADQTIANGQYLGGTQVIKGDANLSPANIRQGVSIFGVAGAMTSQFQATLTVTADAGAVVTATHSGGTEVSTLSANGKVVLELPIEGRWTVTARRGVAQYNSVVVDVSSSYSAELTAEVHIEYYLTGTPLLTARYDLAAATVGNYALFGGGRWGSSNKQYSADVDPYNEELSRLSVRLFYDTRRSNLAAASVGNYALFGGGYGYAPNDDANVLSPEVDSFNTSLTLGTPTALSKARQNLAAVSIGEYALFGGGEGSSSKFSTVDAYNTGLTRSKPTELSVARSNLAAAAVGGHALFGGGLPASASNVVDAYDAKLTRSLPTVLSVGRYDLAAAVAGNYILFAGGRSGTSASYVVDAYDLFLTRSTPEELGGMNRYRLAGTTVAGYALFAGGGSDSSKSGAVDVYDAFLTRTTPKALSVSRNNLAATALGDYALFGGGSTNGTPYSGTIDIYRHV